MTMRKISDLSKQDLIGKYVLLRDDFNVQIVDGKITDSFRIDKSVPTINYLTENGARVVICAHLGRPKGEYNKDLSLQIVADYMNIPFVHDCLEKDFLHGMKNGDVVLMENLRFYNGEEKNEDDFAKKLSDGFDLYVNDGFAVSHRNAASVSGITKYLPSFAGLLLAQEIENLTNIMQKPNRPLLVFVGGGKVSTKLKLLKRLIHIADKLVIGGAMGTTFNYARGYNVGNSLYEPDMKQDALDIIDLAKENNCELYFPLDKGVGKTFSYDATRINKPIDEITDDDVIMDDGDKTISRNAELLKDAKTVIWNGPFGVTEWGEKWGKSSFEFAKTLAQYTREQKLESVVGGGDSVSVLNACDVMQDISYVSTGGGAFLEFIQGDVLPGIDTLIKNNIKSDL